MYPAKSPVTLARSRKESDKEIAAKLRKSAKVTKFVIILTSKMLQNLKLKELQEDLKETKLYNTLLFY